MESCGAVLVAGMTRTRINFANPQSKAFSRTFLCLSLSLNNTDIGVCSTLSERRLSQDAGKHEAASRIVLNFPLSFPYIDVTKRLELAWSIDPLGHYPYKVTEQLPPILNHQDFEFPIHHQYARLISKIISQQYLQVLATSCGFASVSVNVPQ